MKSDIFNITIYKTVLSVRYGWNNIFFVIVIRTNTIVNNFKLRINFSVYIHAMKYLKQAFVITKLVIYKNTVLLNADWH